MLHSEKFFLLGTHFLAMKQPLKVIIINLTLHIRKPNFQKVNDLYLQFMSIQWGCKSELSSS